MSDEMGSVMMDGEEELVMPTIPIRPNNAIPVAIGILLILSSILSLFLALGSAAVFLVDDELRAEGGFTDEQNRTFDMMKESGMATTFTVLYGSMALGLIVAGVMLIRKNPLGVKIGMAAGSILLLRIMDLKQQSVEVSSWNSPVGPSASPCLWSPF